MIVKHAEPSTHSSDHEQHRHRCHSNALTFLRTTTWSRADGAALSSAGYEVVARRRQNRVTSVRAFAGACEDPSCPHDGVRVACALRDLIDVVGEIKSSGALT